MAEYQCNHLWAVRKKFFECIFCGRTETQEWRNRIQMSRERIIHLTKRDFQFSYFRVSGAGGQKRDKTSAGCRCVHPPSGASGQATESRKRSENQKVAFRRMAESERFQNWIRLEHAKRIGAIESAVDDAMRPENLLVEYAESFPEAP